MTSDQAVKLLMIGNIEKPFHLCECACDLCEEWRVKHHVPTVVELTKIARKSENK